MNVTIELQIKQNSKHCNYNFNYNIVHLLIFAMKTWHSLTFQCYIGCVYIEWIKKKISH